MNEGHQAQNNQPYLGLVKSEKTPFQLTEMHLGIG
jgi:hypothetical protein